MSFLWYGDLHRGHVGLLSAMKASKASKQNWWKRWEQDRRSVGRGCRWAEIPEALGKLVSHSAVRQIGQSRTPLWKT